MIVELVLAGIFFVICFNDQLGGWVEAATHNGGGGGLRSLQHAMPSLQDTWSRWGAALALARALRYNNVRVRSSVFGAMAGRPTVSASKSTAESTSNTTVAHTATSSNLLASRNWRGLGGKAALTEASPSGVDPDPLAELGNMYGITIVRTPGLYLFLFLLSYIVAAGTEETLKYMTPMRFRACRHSSCPYVYLVCAVACALGFSTVENMGYTFQASAGQTSPSSSESNSSNNFHTSTPPPGSGGGSGGGGGGEELMARAYTAYSRAVVAIAAHALFGGLVGLGLTKRHVLAAPLRYHHILLPSVLAHGTFDFQQMLLAIEVWDEQTQSILVIILDAVLLLFAAVYLLRQVATLSLRFDACVFSVPLVRGVGSGEGAAGSCGEGNARGGAAGMDADNIGLLSAQRI